MTGSVLYPRFGLAVRERDSDERGARVVCADLLTRVGALEEDAARDAGGDEMLAVLYGSVVDVDAFAVQVDEDEVVGLGGNAVVGEKDAPRMESAGDTGRQGPRAWIVGLVDVENNATAIEVEVGPCETRSFVDSWSFAMKEAVQDAVLERNGIRCNELGVFVWVDPPLGFAGSDFGEESRRQWVCRDELQRKNRHLANTIHDLRNVPTSRDRIFGRTHATHDGTCVIKRKRINGNIADNRIYVVFEAADVVADRLLYAHVIRIIARKVAPCPSLAQFANGRHFGIGSATLTNEVDIAKDLLERLGIRSAGSGIEIRARDVEAPGFTKFVGNFRKSGGAGVSLGFGLAGRKGDGGAIG